MTVATPSEAGDQALRRTLATLGLARESLEPEKWEVLARAEPRHAEMSAVYGRLNHDLRQMVSLAPIQIQHITGEARVLVDPAHRNVIAADWQSGDIVRIACRQPDQGRIVDAGTFISAQKARWSGLSWMDLIDVLSLCADGKMAIYVLAEPATVHYSLFGNDRILLQEEHVHPTERKAVWYLQSSELVRKLIEPTERKFEWARLLPPQSFDEVLRWLYSETVFPIVNATAISSRISRRLDEADIARLEDLGIVEKTTKGALRPLLRPIPAVSE